MAAVDETSVPTLVSARMNFGGLGSGVDEANAEWKKQTTATTEVSSPSWESSAKNGHHRINSQVLQKVSTQTPKVSDADEPDVGDSASRCVPSASVRRRVKLAVYVLVTLAYFVYFTLAMVWNFKRALPLLCVTVVVVLRHAWRHFTRLQMYVTLRHTVQSRFLNPTSALLQRRGVTLACYGVATAAMLTYCVIVNWRHPENLISLAGLVTLLGFSWCISMDRSHICWRPVVWGVGTQLLLGVVVLKTQAGRDAFAWAGQQVELFLDYVTAGVLFVFGEHFGDFFFAFKLMPTVIFVSSVISVLYHVGVMQVVIKAIAMVMRVTMGTTAPETVCTAASIFLGQPEASLTIRPYLRTMSNSELHAIMTAGFASVAVGLFALLVNYGVPSAHILTAVFMSAPAGLAVSKIVCPEDPKRRGKPQDSGAVDGHTDSTDEARNILDAAARGAGDGVPVVLTVCATLIAFLAMLDFLNHTLTYLGTLVNIQGLTLELMLSYVFIPLAFLMGAPWRDCRVVGEVIGLKTVLNEVVGYERLGEYIRNSAISRRAEVIAVYALCGFSNPTTVGITLGGLGALVPERRQDLARHVISAWISGCVACFLTACFAGLLVDEDSLGDSTTSQNATSTLAL